MIIAKIAKFDFPKDWPTHFSDLVELIKAAQTTNNLVQLNNLLGILNQSVKILSVTRFGAGRAGFQAAAPDLVKVTGELYLQLTQQWMQSFDLATMEVGYKALKVTGKLIAEGYSNCNRYPEASSFFNSSVEHFIGFASIYDNQPAELIAKHIRGLGKIYAHIFERQPVAFVLMSESLQLIRSYLTIFESKASILQNVGGEDQDEESTEFWEKIVVQGLKLVKKVISLFYKNGVSTIRYRTVEDKEESKRAFSLLESDFFTPNVITSIVSILLSSYFKLTPRDLESWKSDPEEWIIEQLNDSWEYQARPCAEKVFTDLLANFKSIVGPTVLEFMENASQSDDLLFRDVAYNAFAIASASPFDNIDFDDMLARGFLPQGYATGSDMYSIIRRRISIIISEWVSVQCSAASRIEIYKLVEHFLNPQDPLNDRVVKLYACQALRYTVDEWNTDLNDFIPFLPVLLERMFLLLTKDLSLMESKKFVLQVLSVIVDRVERQIAPYTDMILQILPPLWDASEDNYQMKCIILQTLSNLISSTGENSTKCYSLAMPMLQVSVDPTSELFTYLLEDALPLWEVLAENAPSVNEHLLSLLPLLINLIENNTENLTLEIKILESYVLLDSKYLIANFGSQMFKLFALYLPNMTIESASWVNSTLNLLAINAPFEEYGDALMQSGLFASLVSVLLHEDTSPITCVEILGNFSRMALENGNAFLQFLEMTGLPDGYKPREGSPAPSSAVVAIIDAYINRFDNMGHPRERKLNALGITAIVKTGCEPAMSFLPDIMAIWTQLLDEVSESEAGDAEIYYSAGEYYNPNESMIRASITSQYPTPQHPDPNGADAAALMSPETHRRRALHTRDPVHTVRLKNYISATLEHVQNLSPDHAKYFATSLDPGLVDTLAGVLKLP